MPTNDKLGRMYQTAPSSVDHRRRCRPDRTPHFEGTVSSGVVATALQQRGGWHVASDHGPGGISDDILNHESLVCIASLAYSAIKATFGKIKNYGVVGAREELTAEGLFEVIRLKNMMNAHAATSAFAFAVSHDV